MKKRLPRGSESAQCLKSGGGSKARNACLALVDGGVELDVCAQCARTPRRIPPRPRPAQIRLVVFAITGIIEQDPG